MDGGNRNYPDTESEAPLRDWQKNTWYGPAPVDEDPFDEPADAPELRDLRSENLNNRSGAFWEQDARSQMTTGYRFGAQATDSQPAGKPPAEKKARGAENERKKNGWLIALACTAAALILGAALYFWVFSVRDIQVTGNSRIPAGEVIRLSGIRVGTPIFSVSSEETERRLRQNPYLKFRYLEKKLPGTLILSVREREACCWMTWNGILYTMDKQRMVLFETEDLTVRPSELVRVDGLGIRSDAKVGQVLMLDSEMQQQIFTSLFLEMKVLRCTELIEEADLSNASSILLTTRDGFTVAMGDSSALHAKLRAMLITREELLSRGYKGGVINVILPETPVFSPASN